MLYTARTLATDFFGRVKAFTRTGMGLGHLDSERWYLGFSPKVGR